MRKRLIRALIFIVIALGVAIGAAGAAGAIDLNLSGDTGTDGMTWGWGGSAAASTAELASA
jgi:hypothetical protein